MHSGEELLVAVALQVGEVRARTYRTAAAQTATNIKALRNREVVVDDP